MPHKETGERDEWPPPAMKEGPRDTAGTKERHTAGRGHRRQGSKGAREQGTQAAGQRKDRDELRHNGYVLIKGKRLKNFKLQFGHIINEATLTTVQGKRPTPPLPRRRRCLSALLKFAPYFSANLSLCNSILQNRTFGLANPEGDKLCSQENVEKRGILGGVILWRAIGRTLSMRPVPS